MAIRVSQWSSDFDGKIVGKTSDHWLVGDGLLFLVLSFSKMIGGGPEISTLSDEIWLLNIVRRV